MPLIVGTSGWQYRHWRSTFYPPGVAQARWLEFYGARFATVESNASFYRLPEAETFAAWAERTPPDFVMAVKASRYLTHVLRLAEPQDAVALFVERARRLGDKLGPVLLQLPPSLRVEPARLRDTLAAFPAGWRVAVEFRHDSWYTDEIRALLQERSVALCLADRRRPLTPDWPTADWGYVRFHAGRGRPPGSYGRDALGGWIERIATLWPATADVFVYFNNDGFACALRDARVFAQLGESAGLATTRIPGPAGPIRRIRLEFRDNNRRTCRASSLAADIPCRDRPGRCVRRRDACRVDCSANLDGCGTDRDRGWDHDCHSHCHGWRRRRGLRPRKHLVQ